MSSAAARARQPLPLTATAIQAVLIERGLRVTVAHEDQLVAEYPVRPARITHDPRKSVVLTRDDRGNWRGVLMVALSTNGFEVKNQVTQFRDLLHVATWTRWHAENSAQPTLRQLTLREVH